MSKPINKDVCKQTLIENLVPYYNEHKLDLDHRNCLDYLRHAFELLNDKTCTIIYRQRDPFEKTLRQLGIGHEQFVKIWRQCG